MLTKGRDFPIPDDMPIYARLLMPRKILNEGQTITMYFREVIYVQEGFYSSFYILMNCIEMNSVIVNGYVTSFFLIRAICNTYVECKTRTKAQNYLN